MARRAVAAMFTVVSIDHTSSTPLFRQLYEGMRVAILGGQLAAGVRVPSTRALARELGVSRHTVLTAFAYLLSEGYVEGKRGAGTYIARIRPSDGAPFAVLSPANHTERGPSRRGGALASTPTHPDADRPAAFRVGLPALDVFPYRLWSRLLARHWRRSARQLLGYDDSSGYRPLREAIAAYLGASRGIRCTPARVIVVSGAQQAVTLAAQALLDPGDAAWIADPGPPNIRAALQLSGVRPIAVPVDDEGLDVAAGIARCADARLACVAPSHQFPLGSTMSLERRVALLEWARWSGACILEGDECSEYRYGGRPLPALQALDNADQVVYYGTFSALLFPTLRLGYVVAPPALVDTFVAARRAMDLYSPALEQAILADFIASGYLAHHVRQMRAVYARRQAALVAARELAGLLDVRAATSGLSLLGWLSNGMDDRAAARRAAGQGVDTAPLSSYTVEQARPGALLLGYAATTEAEIEEGIHRLAKVLTA